MARAPRTPEIDIGDTGDDKPVFDQNNGAAFTDIGIASSHSGASGDSEPEKTGKKRSRSPKNASETVDAAQTGRKSKTKGDLFITAKMVEISLMTINNTLAAQFKQPAYILEQSEATILAPAVLGVLDHYGLAKIRSKYGVWANLFIALGFVYGPKTQTALGLGDAGKALNKMREWTVPQNDEGLALMGAFQ